MNDFMLNLFERLDALRKSRTFRVIAWSAYFVLLSTLSLYFTQSDAQLNAHAFVDAPMKSWVIATLFGIGYSVTLTILIPISIICGLYLPTYHEVTTLEDQQ